MLGQVIWMTGLSAVGKITLANELTARLQQSGLQLILLDEDILRKLLKTSQIAIDAYNRKSRIKLAFKYAQMFELHSSQGFKVVIATISKFDEVYTWNRENLPNYFEVYLKVVWKNYSIVTLSIFIGNMKVAD